MGDVERLPDPVHSTAAPVTSRSVAHPKCDFVDTNDFSVSELAALMTLIGLLRDAKRADAVPELLPRRTLGLFSEKTSPRADFSLQVAMAKLGGRAVPIGFDELGDPDEFDSAAGFARMCDVVEVRVRRHETVLRLADELAVPVINGLSDYNHPTQGLCDLFTIAETLPRGRVLEDCRIVFVGDRTSVCSSLMQITTKFGMHFVHAAPEGYGSPPDWLRAAERNIIAAGRHGSVAVTDEVEDAVAGADFVYADSWLTGEEGEIAERKAAFLPRYQVNELLMVRAGDAAFMHCLPASRGLEVTDAVIDGSSSIVLDQAENRLYTEMALLAWLVRSPLSVSPSSKVPGRFDMAVRQLLDDWAGAR